jgi:hypothetical protein
MKPATHFFRLSAILITLILLATLPTPLRVWATSTSPHDPGSATDLAEVGTATWIFPGNITTSGPPYTMVTLQTLEISHYLQASAYGFQVPSGSTIDGITVVINRMSSGADTPYLRDYQVSLIKDGVISGENKADNETDWPFSYLETATYGGVSDLWGTTWTVDDINDADFGVVLAVTNPNNSMQRTATLDYIQVTVNYTLPDTNTSVDCGDGDPSTSVGESIECVATVTRLAGDNTPGGSVNWTTSDSGDFNTSPCTLSGTNGTATCKLSYIPSAVDDGSHTVTATYAGDINFTGSSGNQDVTVVKGTPTLSVTNSPAFYDGDPKTAVVIGSVPGVVSNILYDGSPTAPSEIGTYAVTADFEPADTTNYESLITAPAGDFIIKYEFVYFLPFVSR